MFPSAARTVPTKQAPTGQAGFTVYEAIIVLGILSMLSLGAVGLKELIERHELLVCANQLIADLHLARSEAIKRKHPVTLCKSNNGLGCTRTAPWESGWIVFTDANSNQQVDPKESVIHVQQLSTAKVSLRYGETGSYHYVTYYPTGYASPNATFTLCRKHTAKSAKGIIVHWTGRARIANKKSDGSPLQCTKS